MNLPFGILADRYCKKKILVYGDILNSTAFIIAGWTQSYHVFLCAMLLAGIIAGSMLICTVPVVDATLADVVHPSLRGRMNGIALTIGILIGDFSPYITGLAYDYEGGYRLAYNLLGVSVLAVASMTVVIPGERPHA